MKANVRIHKKRRLLTFSPHIPDLLIFLHALPHINQPLPPLCQNGVKKNCEKLQFTALSLSKISKP